MDFAFRLERAADLRESIEQYCDEHQISAGCIISCVGCVYQVSLRMVGGEIFKTYKKDFEIVSLTGTVSKNGCHLHISLSDADGTTIGGHLCAGTLVNTTAEIVIHSLDEKYLFTRELDDKTGWKELIIKEK